MNSIKKYFEARDTLNKRIIELFYEFGDLPDEHDFDRTIEDYTDSKWSMYDGNTGAPYIRVNNYAARAPYIKENQEYLLCKVSFDVGNGGIWLLRKDNRTDEEG